MSEDPIEERTVFNVLNHDLVPRHEVLPPEDKEQLMRTFGITEDQFPKIVASDAAARACGARPGDIIKITRSSPTAGEAVAYRLCVEFA